jgi:hypothetical protein
MSPDVLDLLQQELAFFEQSRAELVKTHAGKFALVKGRRLIDTFTTFEEAYAKGVELFRTEPFLVKCVLPEDPKQAIPVLSLSLIHASLQ